MTAQLAERRSTNPEFVAHQAAVNYIHPLLGYIVVILWRARQLQYFVAIAWWVKKKEKLYRP